MTTTNVSALRFWFLSAAALAVILWIFTPVLFPFLAGLTIAYFLEPAVCALEKRKVTRSWGALIVLSVFLFVVASILLMLWPMLSSQISHLIYALPDYAERLREHFMPWMEKWLPQISPEDFEKIRSSASQSTGDAVGLVSRTLQGILSRGAAVVDALILSVLAPVTAYYVLKDWHKLIRVIDSLIPRAHRAVITKQLAEIDQTLSGFVRGQGLVGLILGAYYATGLSLSGLEYGATIGIVSGALTIVPYMGTIFGWITSFILSFVQFEGDWAQIGPVMLVFIIGNFAETYVLTPKLVGSRVRLHPVWILFAIIAGIKLIGFTGALIAVPLASVAGVLARFGAEQYRASSLYK
ncbi:MAG: AI-2E family transporter [Alphaproteobacteria bacterium]|nr:AI-2E family transporter [Alphaproteobacteria bacterium]